jgi:hypothetical protein
MHPTKLSALAALSLAACAAPSTENAQSSGEQSLSLAGVVAVSVSATGNSATLAYIRGTGTASTWAHVTGPGYDQTQWDSDPSPQRAIPFLGLAPCTRYAFAIGQGAQEANGVFGTTLPNGAPCPTGETLAPVGHLTMRGVDHQRFDHSWCTSGSWNNAYRIYPEGPAWLSRDYNAVGAVDMRIGYQHYYDSGSDPFPCGERFVDAYRGIAKLAVSPMQQQNLRTATVRFNYQSWGSGGPRGDFCGGTTFLYKANYPYLNVLTSLNDYGQTWADALGGVINWWGLEKNSVVSPIAAANGSASIDVTSTLKANGSQWLGLASASDGFSSMLVPENYMSFAQDNDECISDVTNLVLDVVYDQPPPAASPACTWSFTCDGSVTLACTSVPYDVRVDRLDNINGTPWWRMLAYETLASRTGGTGIYDTSPHGLVSGDIATYRVCAVSPNAHEDTCTQVIVDLPQPSCGGGGGGGGGTWGPPHHGPIRYQ